MENFVKVPMKLVRLDPSVYLPKLEDMKPGEFYYSSSFEASSHLCPCGCGHRHYLPINSEAWRFSNQDDKLTLMPQVYHRLTCQNQYVISCGTAFLNLGFK